MSDQKAIYITELCKPLVLVDRPIPTPGENEILVKVTSAGLNPHDEKSRSMGLFVRSIPYIPAHDIAGEVIALGPGKYAAAFSVGEHIFAQSRLPLEQSFNDFNGLQQYALADAKYAAKVSETGGLTDDEAATIPVNVATGYTVFFHENGFGFQLPGTTEKEKDYSTEKLVVIGGATNCGRYVIQFAKWLGFGTIVAVAGPTSAQELRDIGATHIVDRHADDVVGQVRAIVGDELIYALDAVYFGPYQILGTAILSNSKRGTLITLAPALGELDANLIGEKKAGFSRRFIRGACAVHPDEFTRPFWERINGWLRDKVILPSKFRVIEGLDADAINAALDECAQYGVGPGLKVQVHPNPA